MKSEYNSKLWYDVKCSVVKTVLFRTDLVRLALEGEPTILSEGGSTAWCISPQTLLSSIYLFRIRLLSLFLSTIPPLSPSSLNSTTLSIMYENFDR